MLIPILVLGAGRNGSTALMSLLGGSPEIEFDRTYPYEKSYLTYFAMYANLPQSSRKVASENGWTRQSLRQQPQPPLMGPIPFPTQEYLGIDFRESLLSSIWSGFSNHIQKMRAEEGKIAPTHYAEKVTLPNVEVALAGLPEARRIHLLRDPRDVLLSTRDFNKKRGVLRFGWIEGDTDLSYATRQIPKWRKRLEKLAELKDGTTANDILLRYEDFMGDTNATAQRLSDFIGTPIDPKNAIPKVAKHTTSASVGASLDRWRTELSSEVNDYFKAEMGTELQGVGYEI